MQFACLDLGSMCTPILVTIACLIFFSVVFEWLIHWAIHVASQDRFWKQYVAAMLAELSMLGLVSFTLFVLSQFKNMSDDDLHVIEFVHLTLFITMLVYYSTAAYIARCSKRILDRFGNFEEKAFNFNLVDCISDLRVARSQDRDIKYWLPGQLRIMIFGANEAEKHAQLSIYLITRHFFLMSHNLPYDMPFDYCEYVDRCTSAICVKLIRVGWRTWAVILTLTLSSSAVMSWLGVSHGASLEGMWAESAAVNRDFFWGIFFIGFLMYIVNGLIWASFERTRARLIFLADEQRTKLNMVDSVFDEDEKSRGDAVEYESFNDNSSEHRKTWQKTEREPRSQYCPCIYEHDRWRECFPVSAPEFPLRTLQVILMFFALFVSLCFLVFFHINPTYACFSIVQPFLYLYMFAKNQLPLYATLRFFGPNLSKYCLVNDLVHFAKALEMGTNIEGSVGLGGGGVKTSEVETVGAGARSTTTWVGGSLERECSVNRQTEHAGAEATVTDEKKKSGVSGTLLRGWQRLAPAEGHPKPTYPTNGSLHSSLDHASFSRRRLNLARDSHFEAMIKRRRSAGDLAGEDNAEEAGSQRSVVNSRLTIGEGIASSTTTKEQPSLSTAMRLSELRVSSMSGLSFARSTGYADRIDEDKISEDGPGLTRSPHADGEVGLDLNRNLLPTCKEEAPEKALEELCVLLSSASKQSLKMIVISRLLLFTASVLAFLIMTCQDNPETRWQCTWVDLF